MGLILSDAVRFAQTPLPLDSLDGGERGTDDVLGNLHHPLHSSCLWQCSCYCDTVCQYALDGAAVEVHQDLRGPFLVS